MPLVSQKSKTLNALGGGQNGLIAPQNRVSTANTALVSNSAYGARFTAPRTLTINSISFRVATASGTNDNVDVGIYDDAGNRLVSSGAVASKLNSTGTKNVPITATKLTVGKDYYAVISAPSTATLVFAATIGDAFGTTMGLSESWVKSTAHPLPATISTVTNTDSAPLLFLLE
jgi:hypothetical protein